MNTRLKQSLLMSILGCTLGLAILGCQSPYLSEDASTRLAAVNAVANRPELARIALDCCYSSGDYKETCEPFGCPMDVRLRAVERLSDVKLLAAVSTFSVSRISREKGTKRCFVTLSAPNRELQAKALSKLLTEGACREILSRQGSFATEALLREVFRGADEEGIIFRLKSGTEPSQSFLDLWSVQIGKKEEVLVSVLCSIFTEGVTDAHSKILEILPKTISKASQAQLTAAFDEAPFDSRVFARRLDAALTMQRRLPSLNIDQKLKVYADGIKTMEAFSDFIDALGDVPDACFPSRKEAIGACVLRLSPTMTQGGNLKKWIRILEKCNPSDIPGEAMEDALIPTFCNVFYYGMDDTYKTILALLPDTLSQANQQKLNEALAADTLNLDAALAVKNRFAFLDVDGKLASEAKNITSLEAFSNFIAITRLVPDDVFPSRAKAIGACIVRLTPKMTSKEMLPKWFSALKQVDSSCLPDPVILEMLLNSTVVETLRSETAKQREYDRVIDWAAQQSRREVSNELEAVILEAIIESERKGNVPEMVKFYALFVVKLSEQESFIALAQQAPLAKIEHFIFQYASSKLTTATLATCCAKANKKFPGDRIIEGATLGCAKLLEENNQTDLLPMLQPALRNISNAEGENRLTAITYLLDVEEAKAALLGVTFEKLDEYSSLKAAEKKHFPLYYKAMKHILQSYTERNDDAARTAFIESASKAIQAHKFFLFSREGCEFRWGSAKTFMRGLLEEVPEVWIQIVCDLNLCPQSETLYEIKKGTLADPALLVQLLSYYVTMPPCSEHRGQNSRTHKPIEIYKCPWFWDTTLELASKDLDKDTRIKLDQVMKTVALASIDTEIREQMLNAIATDSIRQSLLDEWKSAMENISSVANEYIAFCFDKDLTEAAKNKLFAQKYSRIRLRGKVVSIEQDRGFVMTVDGREDCQDSAFAQAEIEKGNAYKSLSASISRLDTQIENQKRTIQAYGGTAQKSVTEMMRLQLENYQKERAQKELERDKISFLLQYKVKFPQTEEDALMAYKPGDMVVFECTPGILKRFKESQDDETKGWIVFSADMKDGRIIPEGR